MDAISAVSRPLPYAARGPQPSGDTEAAAPVDRFTPSGEVGGRSRADREADAALLGQCAGGCGCLSCSPVAGDDDPLKTLRARDAEVRTHEAEHFNAAGEFAAGGPSYDFVTTRSGQTFAVGGKVHVDISEIAGDPKRTLEKMQKIRRAALAPATPSDQDRRVAAEASMKEFAAQQKLAEMEQQGGGGRALATA